GSMSLPLELLIEIVKLALVDESGDQFGRIGHDAAWKMPRPNALDKLLAQDSRIDDKIATTFSVPNVMDTRLFMDPSTGFNEQVGTASVNAPKFYAAAKSMRLYVVVIPALYKDVNLLVNVKDVSRLDMTLNQHFLPRVRYIQSLYLWGNTNGPDVLEECNVKFLRECTSLVSLGLYRYPINSTYVSSELVETVLYLMNRGKLACLGFYSPEIVKGGNTFHNYWTVPHILVAISKSETASSRLKSLDFAVWLMPNIRVDWIQSKFPKLESLAIRCSAPATRPMDQWKPSAVLTRLQLNNCNPITPLDIPDLILLFPALCELTVIDLCPSLDRQPFHERYPDGWHLLPNALCNTHQRLDWIYCDHLNANEIQFMGVIPTRILIIIATEVTEIARALEPDPHIFPGLEVLRWDMSIEYGTAIANDTLATDALERWCAARNIEAIEGVKGAYGSCSS
ncbi:11864_t:CDS:2, partial [Acaulospora colombiana]